MAAQLTVRATKIKKRKILISILAAALILGTALIAWQAGLFSPAPQPFAIGFPGSGRESPPSMRLDKQAAGQLEARMNALLAGSSGFLAEWYQLAGRGNLPPAVLSDESILVDQLRYGQYLLEQERRRDFLAWWAAIRQNFLLREGTLQPFEADQTDCLVRDNLLILRILAQSCALWPDQARNEALRSLSAAWLDDIDGTIPALYEIAVPTPGPVLDPAATPTPKPENEPEPDPEEQPRRSILRISSIDLYALRQLAVIDGRWQDLYDKYLPIVANAYLSDDLPLYALGYDLDNGAYIPYAGESPLVLVEESMLTALHLSEVGELSERSYSWIMDQIYNYRTIYTSYHLTLAAPASDRESLPAYAMICRITRIRGDEALYAQTVQRLLWHQATSQTSQALHALFRESATGEYQVWAIDNTWALLAIR